MPKNMDISTYDVLSESQNEKADRGPANRENGGILDWEALDQATKCLKSVAHPIRLRILELLTDGEYTVGELADLCEVEQSTASDHLGKLRDRGILFQERRGRQVYYRIAATAISGIVSCMRSNFGPGAPEAEPRCGS